MQEFACSTLPERRQCLTIALLLFSFTFPQTVSLGQELRDKRDIEEYRHVLDTWLGAQMVKHQIPGLAVAVVHDQETIYQNVFGFANLETRESVDDKTLFRIGSLSKLFTSIAIMQLRDDRKVRLDDYVAEHVPWVVAGEDSQLKGAITIRQLLTHSGGLSSESIGNRGYWSDLKFPTLDEIKGDGVHRPLLFRPGEKFKYSNLGMELLGQRRQRSREASAHDRVGTA